MIISILILKNIKFHKLLQCHSIINDVIKLIWHNFTYKKVILYLSLECSAFSLTKPFKEPGTNLIPKNPSLPSVILLSIKNPNLSTPRNSNLKLSSIKYPKFLTNRTTFSKNGKAKPFKNSKTLTHLPKILFSFPSHPKTFPLNLSPRLAVQTSNLHLKNWTRKWIR